MNFLFNSNPHFLPFLGFMRIKWTFRENFENESNQLCDWSYLASFKPPLGQAPMTVVCIGITTIFSTPVSTLQTQYPAQRDARHWTGANSSTRLKHPPRLQTPWRFSGEFSTKPSPKLGTSLGKCAIVDTTDTDTPSLEPVLWVLSLSVRCWFGYIQYLDAVFQCFISKCL